MSSAGLIRSGWWVLVAAVAVSVVVVVVLLRVPLGLSTKAPLGTIALEPAIVDPDAIVDAMPRDALQALTEPASMDPAAVLLRNESERGKLLVSSDPVIGVAIGGEARAYPLRLLRWHEAVNDTVGNRAIAVTYSPLSGGIAVWDRVVDGAVVEFGVSGRLLDSNTLLYDRQPEGAVSSLWHQLTGEAITGPAVGQQLEALAASLTTWADWIATHPETTVMAPDPGSKRLYKRDPYHSYRGSDVLRFPVDPLAPEGELALKDLVAAVDFPHETAFFALPYLAQAAGQTRGRWATLHEEDAYVIEFDHEAGTFAITANDTEVSAPPVRFGYWFEWYALDPETIPLP